MVQHRRSGAVVAAAALMIVGAVHPAAAQVNFDVRNEAEFRAAVARIPATYDDGEFTSHTITFRANVTLSSPLEITTIRTVTLNTNGFDVAGPLSSSRSSSVYKTGAGRLALTSGPVNLSGGFLRILGGDVDVKTWATDDITLQAGESMKVARLSLFAPVVYDSFCPGASGPTREIDTDRFTLTVDDLRIACANLKKTGAGTLILNGLSRGAYPGGNVLVSAGTLQLNSDRNLSGLFRSPRLIEFLPLTLDGGTLRAGTALTLFDSFSCFPCSPPVEVPVELGARGGTFDTNGFSITVGSIRGSGSLTKIGQGALVLTRPSTYTGITRIETGAIRIGAGGALPATTALTVAGGAVLDGNNQAVTIGSLAGAGTVSLGAGSLTVGGNGLSTTFEGSIGGAGRVIKTGNGSLVLTGRNTYSGGTTIDGGTLAGTTTSLRGAIRNHAVLGFEQTTDGVFDGAISGSGALVKTGDAALTFAQAQTYTGLTRLAGGRLNFTGGLAGSVLVDAGAVLNGRGPIGGSVRVNGTFIPDLTGAGASPLIVAGDLELGATATYTLQPGAAGSSVPRIGGRFTIAGATLAIQGSTAVSSRSQTFALLDAAGGTTGDFGRVSSSSPLDAFVSSRGSTALVTLQRTDVPFTSLATTSNGRAAGSSLDATRATATTDLRSVIRELGALPDAGTAGALAQLSGDAYATSAALATLDGERVVQLIGDRLTDIRTIAEPADRAARSSSSSAATGGFWLRSINQSSSTHAEGWTTRLDGALLGFDRALGTHWMAGAAGGYDRGELTTENTSTVSDRRYRGGGYVTYAHPGYYLSAAVLGAHHSYVASRHLSFAALLDSQFGGGLLFGGIDWTAGARISGFEASGMFEAGATRSVAGLSLEPLAGVEWSRVRREAFAEQDAGSIALVAPAGGASSARAAIGLRARRAFPRSVARWAPHASVRYSHELLDRSASFTTAFADGPGAPFTVRGSSLGAGSTIVSAGIVALAGRGVMISGTYHGSLESWRRVHTVSLGIGF